MHYEIYKHTSPSGKTYVGITSETTQTRFKNHCRKARMGSTVNFHKAIRKYGEDVWVTEILDTFYSDCKKSAYAREQAHIDLQDKSYNMGCGFGWSNTDRSGVRNPMYGKTSGNAHKVSIKGIEFDSVTNAADYYAVNRVTIQRWVKTRNDCYKLN